MSYDLAVLFFIAAVLSFWFRERHIRTTSIGIFFFGEHHMPSTGTTNNGSPLFATILPVQSSGANSNGVVSKATWELSDVSIATIAQQGVSPSGVSFAQFNPLKIGTATVTVTATVTDPDGTVNSFTTTANLVVIAGIGDVLTASIEVLFSSTQPA